ncbi:MAG: cytochrome P450-dit2 [Vezdaea aestivalis]|nr:MAG: cytochrome P450-dit2 [Vezdaea aestivalis]
MAVLILCALLATLAGIVLYALVHPPRNFPRELPEVPFHVSLLPLFRAVDQADMYKQYLEKPLADFGAIKIYFGARWNILITRPEYVAEMFKDEDIYAKSGNQKKIPYSVLADYTGDNIISAHGENWRLYKGILKPGLQQDFDSSPIRHNAAALVELIQSERSRAPHGGVVVPQILQRYTLANLSESIFGANFETLEKPDAPIHTLQLAVKREVFKPVFLSFPFLDRFPVPSRQRARQLVSKFTDELCKNVCASKRNVTSTDPTDTVATRMLSAVGEGKLSNQQFRHNMIIVFLAGHENPQLQLVSLLYLLAKHQDVQQRLREEIQALGDDQATRLAKAPELAYLTSVLYEALRLYPPTSQIINRKTTRTVTLGGKILIPAGTYVGYNAYATGRDKRAWGEDADAFRPSRWGDSKEEVAVRYRQANSRGAFIAFHGGRRACLGQKFAMFQVRITVLELITRLKWKIDPQWEERMTPAGPLYPAQLRLNFEDL